MRILLSLVMLALLAPASQAAIRVLLVYDGKPDPSSEGYLSAHYIANLLGHFEAQWELRPLDQYRRGDANRYDAVFFASTTTRPHFPAGFLDDAAGTRSTFVWLGRHIGELLAGSRAEQFGFSYIDYRDDEEFKTVLYRNIRLPKGDPDLNLVAVLDQARVRVHAIAQNPDGVVYPYVLQHGSFWYFADSPFSYAYEGDRYLVFCDLLHDILRQPHAASRRAMVRIEDVSVDQDPQDLRAIADYLYSQGIPFQVALIPIFRDPQRGLEVHLSDRRPFVEAVRYMVSRGGSVVMHGVTHQYRGVSADDFEFWNDLIGKPVPNDGQRDALERKLELAFRECFRNGIYPIAWETPHNAASGNTYNFLKDYFTVFHERVLAAPALVSEQYFPYPVRDSYGRFVVPENMGYLKEGEEKTDALVDHARVMLAVRDGIAAFYFHPFLKLDHLKQIVGGLRGLGYEFASLRDFAPQVRFRHWQVAVAGESGQVAPWSGGRPRSDYLRRIVLEKDGTVRQETFPVAAVPATVSGQKFEPGTVVAWEPASRPQGPGPSLLARARQWLFGSPQPAAVTARNTEMPTAALLWNPAARGAAEYEQRGFEAALGVYGYQVERLVFHVGAARPFASPDRLLVVPAFLASQLSPQQQLMALNHLRAGGRLLLAGQSTLAERLGLGFDGRTITVKQVSDLIFPERLLRWEPAETMQRFEPPEDHEALVLDAESRQVLAFSAPFENGKYLYLATPLDTASGLGFARYPYLAHHLQETFDVRPTLLRPRLEVYFDPGYRQDVDRNRLVNAWRKSGIRVVHVAAWHFYPKYEFPYRAFIDLCHRYGIAVYAWFEPPMVTQTFWDEHPEWREKTASGDDGRVGWRYLMNLRNPKALQAALGFFREKILEFDWDGVNLAELNFDAGTPVMDPKKYVPLNDDVRAEFRSRRGFDPVELFRPDSPYYRERNPAALKAFTDYRVQIITDLHRAFLDEMEHIRRQRDLEVMVTMLDSLHSKSVREAIGVDSREILRLMEGYRFTLQVEDPSEFWASSPERYRDFGKTYLGLVKDPSRLMFDVNVVEREVRNTQLPSALATGTEFARLLAAAAAPTGRAAVYSESSVTPQDWELAASVLASGARVRRESGGWRVDAPFAVAVRVPAEHTSFYLDGRPWPVFEAGTVLVPRGTHLLSFSRPFSSLLAFEQLDLRLRSLSGELLSADATSRGMIFEYLSPGRCLAVFNKQPHRVRVDGQEWTAAALYARGEWAVPLPSGRHLVEVVANEPAVFAVEVTSLVFSSFIVFFGFLSCGSMLALYLAIRVRRAARALRRRFLRPVPGVTL